MISSVGRCVNEYGCKITLCMNEEKRLEIWFVIRFESFLLFVFQGLPGDTVFSVSSHFNGNNTSSVEKGQIDHHPTICSSNVRSSSATLVPREVSVTCKQMMAQCVCCVWKRKATKRVSFPAVADWICKTKHFPCVSYDFSCMYLASGRKCIAPSSLTHSGNQFLTTKHILVSKLRLIILHLYL